MTIILTSRSNCSIKEILLIPDDLDTSDGRYSIRYLRHNDGYVLEVTECYSKGVCEIIIRDNVSKSDLEENKEDQDVE